MFHVSLSCPQLLNIVSTFSDVLCALEWYRVPFEAEHQAASYSQYLGSYDCLCNCHTLQKKRSYSHQSRQQH